MDSPLNPLASQDHVPLGITLVASRLLELVTALFDPVPLNIFVVTKNKLTGTVLVKGCHLNPPLSPIGELFLHHLNQGFNLVIRFPLCSGHDAHGGVADC